MHKARKPRGIPATKHGLELLKQAKANKQHKKKRLTYEEIAELTQLDEKTIKRFFGGQPVDMATVVSIVKFFELEIADVIELGASIIEDSVEDLREKYILLKKALATKEKELEQLSFYKDSMSKLERIETEKMELETLVKNSDESIKMLERHLNTFTYKRTVSQRAADWLNDRRGALVKEAVEVVLHKYPYLKRMGGGAESSEKVEEFSIEVSRYLYLIYHCLKLESFNLIYKAIMQSKIPLRLDKTAYLEALRFFKEEKIPMSLPEEEAKEIVYYLHLLIGQIQDLF